VTDPRSGVEQVYEPVLEAALRLFHGGRDRFSLTYSEWGRTYALCKALVEQVGAGPDELARATVQARSRYSVPVTLKLVFDHYSELLAASEVRTAQPAPWKPTRDAESPSAAERAEVARTLGKTRERWLRAV
jgi:hypothetical protein